MQSRWQGELCVNYDTRWETMHVQKNSVWGVGGQEHRPLHCDLFIPSKPLSSLVRRVHSQIAHVGPEAQMCVPQQTEATRT